MFIRLVKGSFQAHIYKACFRVIQEKQSFFKQVRQGRTWSRNYKSPSPSSPTRFRIVQIRSNSQNSIRFSKFNSIFKIQSTFQISIQFSKSNPIFKTQSNFQNSIHFSKFNPIFKIQSNFPNSIQFSKFNPIFKIQSNFHY
jgi:hypothetical protein